jgi:hypothetical protein
MVRITVEPSPRNGLRKPSQLMVDKLFTVPLQAVGEVVGQLEAQGRWIWIWPCVGGWSWIDPGVIQMRRRQAGSVWSDCVWPAAWRWRFP